MSYELFQLSFSDCNVWIIFTGSNRLNRPVIQSQFSSIFFMFLQYFQTCSSCGSFFWAKKPKRMCWLLLLVQCVFALAFYQQTKSFWTWGHVDWQVTQSLDALKPFISALGLNELSFLITLSIEELLKNMQLRTTRWYTLPVIIRNRPITGLDDPQSRYSAFFGLSVQ